MYYDIVDNVYLLNVYNDIVDNAILNAHELRGKKNVGYRMIILIRNVTSEGNKTYDLLCGELIT